MNHTENCMTRFGIASDMAQASWVGSEHNLLNSFYGFNMILPEEREGFAWLIDCVCIKDTLWPCNAMNYICECGNESTSHAWLKDSGVMQKGEEIIL